MPDGQAATAGLGGQQAAGLDLVVSPVPESNEVDAHGQLEAQRLAHDIFDSHRKALISRRERDLLSEKLLLHIDGSGDFQWAEIIYGTRVEIPQLVSEFRKTENVLRLIVDNAVAHHTTNAIQYYTDSPPDRRSKDVAKVDTLWINELAYVQDFNGLFAEALYMAMATGFCPVHAYWRDDTDRDWNEPVVPGPSHGGQGMVDCWVGNPFTTVFDVAAKRNSVRWVSYERILPASLVRAWFHHVPGIETLTGSTRLPSASEFQRIARTWMSGGLGVHGSPVLTERRDKREETLTLIVRETAPASDARWPNGRLQILGVPGAVDTRGPEGSSSSGSAMLLADQPLPGNDFSFENFYSDHRGSDILGKPWIDDKDQLQVDLNIALSKRWEAVNRQMDAPIVSPGGAIGEDMLELDGYSILEVEPSLASWRPQVMQWPASIRDGLSEEIADRRSAIFRAGGYQASSRGEAAGSRQPYRAILALQEADNTIHAPVNQRFRRSAINFAKRCHSQMRMYGDIPWLVSTVGDEYEYLVASYVDNTMMSTASPKYKLTNAFGTSPEMRAQEILELVTLRGADGVPFLSTAEARRHYPNDMMFDSSGDPVAVQKRRARTVAKAIHDKAVEIRHETGMNDELGVSHPWIMQAGNQIFMWAEQTYPRMRDDLLADHIAALSELTQDETADAMARVAATMRQNLYYEWQAMQAGIPTTGVAPGESETDAPVGAGSDKRGVVAQMGGGGIGLKGVEGG